MKVFINLIINNFLMNFWNIWKYTYWPIVYFIIFIIFLWTGTTSPCFSSFENLPVLIQELKFWQMKLLTKSILNFMIFVGMLLPWQVLRTFRFLIILQTSFSFVFLELKVELNSVCLILTNAWVIWNVLIAANTGSWLLLILDAVLEVLEFVGQKLYLQNNCWKFCIILFCLKKFCLLHLG